MGVWCRGLGPPAVASPWILKKSRTYLGNKSRPLKLTYLCPRGFDRGACICPSVQTELGWCNFLRQRALHIAHKPSPVTTCSGEGEKDEWYALWTVFQHRLMGGVGPRVVLNQNTA